MPAKTKTRKKPVKKTSRVRSGGKSTTQAQRLLLIALVLLGASVLGLLALNQLKANDLRAKANRWTTVTPLGKNSGIRFVACKKTAAGSNSFDVTVVASKEKSLQLTKYDQNNKPLSNHPPLPSIFVGTYTQANTAKKAYEYSWEGRLVRPSANANRWWNNEVTATTTTSLGLAAAKPTDKLLVYGMSNLANAPDIRKSGNGQIIVTGSIFSNTPPRPENYPNKPLDYNKARTAWEKQVPTVNSLVNCQ